MLAPTDSRKRHNQLEQSQQLLHTLAESAQQHKATGATEPDVIGAKKPDTARQLPNEKGLYAAIESLNTSQTRNAEAGQDETTIGGGAGTVRPGIAMTGFPSQRQMLGPVLVRLHK